MNFQIQSIFLLFHPPIVLEIDTLIFSRKYLKIYNITEYHILTPYLKDDLTLCFPFEKLRIVFFLFSSSQRRLFWLGCVDNMYKELWKWNTVTLTYVLEPSPQKWRQGLQSPWKCCGDKSVSFEGMPTRCVIWIFISLDFCVCEYDLTFFRKYERYSSHRSFLLW